MPNSDFSRGSDGTEPAHDDDDRPAPTATGRESVDPSAHLLAVAEAVVEEWLTSLIVRVEHQPGNSSRIEPAIDRSDRTPSVLPERARLVVSSSAVDLLERLRQVLTTDVEQQRTNPLGLFRQAVVPINAYLRSEGYQAPPRDQFDRDQFPDDTYGLSPATWADVHPDLAPVGLRWGAWKAATVLARRQTSGGSPSSP